MARMRRIFALAFAAVAVAYLALPLAQTRRGTENGEWRYLGGDAGHTRYSPLDQMTPANFETLKEAWRFSPLDDRRPDDGACHTELRGWQAPERGRLSPARGVDRPHQRQAALELGGAGDVPFEVLDARAVRQRRGLHRDQRQGRRHHLHAGLLPGGARCRHRQAARELGPSDRAARLPAAAAWWTWPRI